MFKYSGLVGLCLLSACSSPGLGPQIGYTLTPEAPPPTIEPKPERARAEVPRDIVERSRLPFYGRRAAGDQKLSAAELFDELGRADAICVGEHHDNPHDHFAELAVVEGLLPRARHTGRALGIGFEMFQKPYQAALDRYVAGEIDEAGLLEESEYEERWGFPFAYYRPLVELGRSAGVRLVALNAPRELTRQVAREGLASLDDKERARLPALDLSDPDHRAAFEAAMSNHPKGKGDPENYYAAQALWDETMAETAAGWLKARAPARQLVIVAGRAHCRTSAVPARIERRARQLSAVNVIPLFESSEEPLQALGYDYALVFTSSKPIASAD